MSIRQRIGRLEDQAEKEAPQRRLPPEVLVLLKTAAREQAREEGLAVPAYTFEEVAENRRQDLELLGGELEKWRANPGWQDEESQWLLDQWQGEAQERVGKAKSLSPERWAEVWGVDDEEDLQYRKELETHARKNRPSGGRTRGSQE